jgi:type I restriction enzyme R subunit
LREPSCCARKIKLDDFRRAGSDEEKHLDIGATLQQATNNTKEQFATSPDLDKELENAIVEALDAHTSMSTQALNSEAVRRGLKNILLNHADLWELLRLASAA